VFRLRDRRGEVTKTRKGGFRIIVTETRGACVIAIIWLNQKVGHEQDGPKRLIRLTCESAPTRKSGGPNRPCI
jgi:hypothetical protein